MTDPTTIEALIRRIPACLVAGFDGFRHRSAADLIFLAQTELDLFDEGEIRLTPSEQESIVAFMARCAKATP